MLVTFRTLTLLCTGLLAALPPVASAQAPSAALKGISLPADAPDLRAERHQTADWLAIQPHLPNPLLASPAELTNVADILRARRLPEDALDFYAFALQRGGEPGPLVNRIGVTLLEMHQLPLAEAAFRRAVRLQPRNSEIWNNLGASEYSAGEFRAAVNDYRKALKYNRDHAVYHSNLGTAYFEMKDYSSASQQFAIALKLDPHVFQGGGLNGVEAHVLSPTDRGHFCFEMARIAAGAHDEAAMLLWLARAAEVGYDLTYNMTGDRNLKPYVNDPRVLVFVHNAKAMHKGGEIADSALVPTLGAAAR